MDKRLKMALLLVIVPVAMRISYFGSMRSVGVLVDRTLDRKFRGCGNKSLRRMGLLPNSCNCIICVEYGGDCVHQLFSEFRTDEHAARRGMKTKGSQLNPIL